MATKTKKSAPKRKAPAETQAMTHARKQMWAVVLFAAGILLGALTLIEGDKFWLTLHNFLFGMFGWSAFFFAPLIIYTAVIATMDKPLSAIKNKVWQVVALIILISAAITIFGEGLPETGGFVSDIQDLYWRGIDLEGGGVCAMLVAMPLIGLFEKTGASIIVSLAIFVFLMLVTGSTLIGLFKSAVRPVKGIEDAYAASIESRELKTQEKAAQPVPAAAAAVKPARFDIDVDISADSEVKEDEPPWEETKPDVTVTEKPEKPEKSENPEHPELPVHPVMSEKPVQRQDPFNAAESPVEYISPEEFSKSLQLAKETDTVQATTVRGHHLADDIIKAEQNEVDAIDNVIDRFLKSNETVMALEPEESDEPVSIREDEPEPVKSIPAFSGEEEQSHIYARPPVNMLALPKVPSAGNVSEEMKQSAQTLVDTLKSFGVQTRVIDICRGPAVTRYELQPSAGVKISKITGLADDIALNLASAGIRIEAPIPNKAAVGIEVPNKVVSLVSIRELIDSHEFKSAESNVSVALGRDITGNITLADIGKMPHILIAGSTGSGKSVCINSIIISILYKASPEEVKLLMVDPKVVELGIYNGIPHLLVPVVTEPKKAAGALNWAVVEMLRRYKVFADCSVRDHGSYNRLAKSNDELKPMPQIVIIIDELADLMMAAPNEVEDSICRLAQMARAAGMHLVIATQRPSVDVITGVIKANIPSRIAFAVSSQVDSRTILDMGGAEKLLGRGDMLFYPVGASKPQRVQGCFVTDSEVESVVEYIKSGEKAQYDQQIVDEIDSHVVPEKQSSKDGGGFDDEDEMLPAAIECVVEAGMASTSLLQRRLKLGYARAARIVDQLEERGIVGPFEGSKPRQVLISKERWIEMKLNGN